MKACTKCKETKPFSCFGKYSRARDGLKEVCRDCRKKEGKQYFKAKDKQRHILDCLRARAKKSGLEYDLEYEDLTPPKYCPVLGVKLERKEPYSKQSRRYSPSVDRINPNKGYTKDNIQIMSNLANVMKHDASPEELIKFSKWVLKTFDGES